MSPLRTLFSAGAALLGLCACCPHAGAQSRSQQAAVQAAADPSSGGEVTETRSTIAVHGAAEMGPRACYGALSRAGVEHEQLRGRETRAVAMPVRIQGPIGGVEFATTNGSETHAVMDCRLAVALSVWAERLSELGITRVEHYSAFRPKARVAGTRKVSGHARAMAVDAARFHFADGRVLNVEEDWADRERGGQVCPLRRGEPEAGELLRTAVCEAVSLGLFQVILTPHHDRAHSNHVHMELVPDVDWTYIR